MFIYGVGYESTYSSISSGFTTFSSSSSSSLPAEFRLDELPIFAASALACLASKISCTTSSWNKTKTFDDV